MLKAKHPPTFKIKVGNFILLDRVLYRYLIL